MPKYANFDHTLAAPQPVTGWYDTDTFTYAVLPDFRDLLLVTDEQWADRNGNFTDWAVDDTGSLIAYTPPMSLPQQAQILLAQNLALGITVTSASLPGINATYALDSVSTAQIFQIGTFANSFGMFPSGNVMQMYPDITSTPHEFTVPVFVAFLLAVAALISNLQTQTGIMSQGGTPTWPPQSVVIT